MSAAQVRRPLLLCIFFFVGVFLLPVMPALAGPPFFTDDPEPVPYKHYEAYAFGTLDRSGGANAGSGPAAEFNVGAAPNLQLHVVVPGAFNNPPVGPSAWGLGDIELGAKYRFIRETSHRPEVGTFPMLEIPSGSAPRGLGNGSTWAKIPVWVQKSKGPWTSYGGAGYTINNQPGMRSYPFGGWLLQRDLNKKLTLGGEFFTQGAPSVDSRTSTILNAGGYYNFTPGFSLLFSAGHTVSGDSHLVGYLGLYWTWGPSDNGQK